jgi:hypothetical protein
MTAKQEDRYAIVWDTIERLAFMPQKPNKWLHLYENTLPDLWGLPRGNIQAHTRFEFDVDFLNLTCKYLVEDIWKYSGCICSLENVSDTIWTIEVDPIHINKSTLYNSTAKYPSQDRQKYLEKDVEKVLNGMIFHPSHHCHLDMLGVTTKIEKSKTTKNGIHDVRVGGGISNAFVFLFHLRYQFSIISDQTREEERNRLTALFTRAISNKIPMGAQRDFVKATELFNF